MSDPASLKTAIEQTLNIILDPRECPEAKLPQMLELAKLPPTPVSETVLPRREKRGNGSVRSEEYEA